LAEITLRAIEEVKEEFPELEVEVEKITDRERFLDYQVLATPGLVINNRLVSHGRIATAAQVELWLREALAVEG
jgi:hypothetical protein